MEIWSGQIGLIGYSGRQHELGKEPILVNMIHATSCLVSLPEFIRAAKNIFARTLVICTPALPSQLLIHTIRAMIFWPIFAMFSQMLVPSHLYSTLSKKAPLQSDLQLLICASPFCCRHFPHFGIHSLTLYWGRPLLSLCIESRSLCN